MVFGKTRLKFCYGWQGPGAALDKNMHTSSNFRYFDLKFNRNILEYFYNKIMLTKKKQFFEPFTWYSPHKSNDTRDETNIAIFDLFRNFLSKTQKMLLFLRFWSDVTSFSFKLWVPINSFRLWISSAKRKCHDQNVFVKVEITLRKLNSHKKYYNVYLSYNNKSWRINLSAREKHKTERDNWISYFLTLYVYIYECRGKFILLRESHKDETLKLP